MKKTKFLCLILCLLLAVCFAFTACGEDEPTVDEPTVDEPTVDEPTVDEPTVDEPAVDEPTADEPTNEPTDEPTDEPTNEPTDEPTGDPTTDEPEIPEEAPEKPQDSPTIDEPTEEPLPDDTVYLVVDGKAEFKFVLANGLSDEVSEAVAELVASLDALGIKVDTVSDDAATLTSCEVLVGAVQSRGEQYKIDPHTLGYDGYAIKAIDGKILILGGSDKALADAILEFKKEVLGISKSTESIEEAYMMPIDNIEKIDGPYDIKSITIADKDISDFVITADSIDTSEYTAAKSLREQIYKRAGIWLDIVAPEENTDSAIAFNLVASHICKSEKGFSVTVKDGKLLIECGFANKIEEAVIAFFLSKIVRAESENPTFAEGYVYEEIDYRNIYYSDFGAVGDGETDDFYAVKSAHDYANEWGHTVNAECGKTYYFGKGSGRDTITINTDTNWAGAEFIFDDSEINAESYEIDEKGYVNNGVKYPGDPEFYTSVFTVKNPNARRITYGADDEKPITSLSHGAENIGFAPGFRAMIVLYDSNIHRFIRYGSGATFLKDQQEIVIVSADGSVDPSTPIQWDYGTVTKMKIIEIDDVPIVINGGEGDERAVIKTLHITSPYSCAYTKRNIYISRANVTVKNIEHTFDDYSWAGVTFYSGFFEALYCDNLVIENSIISASSGSDYTFYVDPSYELNINYSSNVKIKDIQQSNFLKFNVTVATAQYVKNTSYENVKLTNVYAGPGTYNLTVRDSGICATNIVGEGDLIFENVTVYSNKGIVLNNNYGSSWRGKLKIDGLTLKFDYPRPNYAAVLSTGWIAMDYGIDAGLPDVIEISNVTVVPVTVKCNSDGTVFETVKNEFVGRVPLHFCDGSFYTNNNTEPKYEFYEPGVLGAELNRMQDSEIITFIVTYTLTKELYITDNPGLLLNVDSEIFKDMKVYVDGEEYDWVSTGKVEIAKNE